MGFDTIHDALQFVEQLAAGIDSLDTNTIVQQLRDLDMYLQQTLKPKARPCTLSSIPSGTHTDTHVVLHTGKERGSKETYTSW